MSSTVKSVLNPIVAIAFLAVPFVQASAATYKFTASGMLGNAYSVDRNFQEIPTPSASIRAGDRFSISFTINPEFYSVTGLYDADPAINIYYGSVSNYKIQVGVYANQYAGGQLPFSSLQLWDGYISAGKPVDAFVISSLFKLPNGKSPIDHGPGEISEIFGLNAFDFTALARSSDLVEDITPLDGFTSKSAFLGFLNASTYDQTVYSIVNLDSTIVKVGEVPEPGAWAMMIVGFGAVGFSARRRRTITIA